MSIYPTVTHRCLVKTVLKGKEEDDIRRFTIEYAEGSGFVSLLSAVGDTYRVAREGVILAYVDDEGDACTIGGEEELREALRFANPSSSASAHSQTLKLVVGLRPGFQTAPAPSPEPASPSFVLVPSAPELEEEEAEEARSKASSSDTASLLGLGLIPSDFAAPEHEKEKEEEETKKPAEPPTAKFLSDVTLPDGTACYAGITVEKTWRISNGGSSIWPSGVQLVFVKGDILPVPADGATTILPFKLGLPELFPGEARDVSLELMVPNNLRTGKYRADFELRRPFPDEERVAGDYSLFAELQVQGRISASFLSDLTLKDGESVPVNATVKKIWSISNDGPDAWPQGSFLQWIKPSHGPFLAPSPFQRSAGEDTKEEGPATVFPLPLCEVGEKADVELLLTVPSVPGRYKAEFHLFTPGGDLFSGDYRLWADVNAQAPEISKTDLFAQLPRLLEDPEVRSGISALLGQPAHQGPEVHTGVMCDGCDMFPIVGTRYKCTHPLCPDYDLCEKCEEAGKHPVEHTLLKARSPSQLGPRAVPVGCTAGLTAAPEAKTARMPSLPLGSFLGRAASINKEKVAPKSLFVADRTIPDGAPVSVGTIVTKTWAIKNCGSAQWPEGTQLLFVGGTLLPCDANDAVKAGTEGCAMVPLAKPGEEVEISVDVRIPEEAGKRHTGYYRLATADGKRFGCRVWLDVLAVPAETAAAPLEKKEEKRPAVGQASAAAVITELAPAPEVPRATRYAAILAKLRKMGFKDDEMLLDLIEAASGEEQQVIDWLVNPVA